MDRGYYSIASSKILAYKGKFVYLVATNKKYNLRADNLFFLTVNSRGQEYQFYNGRDGIINQSKNAVIEGDIIRVELSKALYPKGIKDKNISTWLFHLSFENNNPSMPKYLSRGDIDLESVLRYAFWYGNLEFIRHLLKSYKIEEKNSLVEMLSVAGCTGNYKLIKYFVEYFRKGKDKDIFHDSLIGACEYGRLKIVKYLLEDEIYSTEELNNIYLRTHQGTGNINVLEYLILKGADPNSLDWNDIFRNHDIEHDDEDLYIKYNIFKGYIKDPNAITDHTGGPTQAADLMDMYLRRKDEEAPRFLRTLRIREMLKKF